MATGADTLALAATLGANQPSTSILTSYREDVLVEWAQRTPWLLDAIPVLHDADNAEYALPDDVVRVDGLAYGGDWLTRETARALTAQSPRWRDQRGRPLAYVTDVERRGDFRLWPSPDTQSGPDPAVPFGEPWGRDFVTDQLVVFGGHVPDNPPDLLVLPLALACCARAFATDTPYQDPAMASATDGLSKLLGLLLAPEGH